MDSINKSEEDLAYQPILRGIIALIVFSCLVLLPHIISFANTVFMDYDDLVNEDEIEDKDSGEPRLSHRIDKSTGMYNGRQILKPKTKSKD